MVCEPNWKTNHVEVLLLKLNKINDNNKMKNSLKLFLHDSMVINRKLINT